MVGLQIQLAPYFFDVFVLTTKNYQTLNKMKFVVQTVENSQNSKIIFFSDLITQIHQKNREQAESEEPPLKTPP